VRELGAAGLDAAWIREAYSFDAISWVVYLAAQTSRVQIGTAAALGDRSVAAAAEIADGWLPFLFIPHKAGDVTAAGRHCPILRG